MSIALQNVQQLPVKNVYNSIQLFLNNKGKQSINTQDAYQSDIILFFSYLRGKQLNELTEDDLKYTSEDILGYQDWLIDLRDNKNKRKYKNTTINRKINSLRAMHTFLKNKYEINHFAFDDIIDLPEKDIEHYGILSPDEAEKMIKEALQLSNGYQKSIIIELACKTSFRMNAILSLTWKQFKKVNDDEYMIHVFDKGNKKDKKPITAQFYERILQLKKKGVENVFQLSRTTMQETIKEICNRLGFDEERNICFHSLKNVGINYILEQTGDIVAACRQGNHSSIQTTYEFYADKNIDNSRYAGIMMEKAIDLTVLDGLDKEQLLQLIKKSSTRAQTELINLAQQGI